MLIKNVRFYGGDFKFHSGDIEINNGCFKNITEHEESGEDALLMLPGLVDIHLHGNSGSDFSDGDYEGLVKIAHFLADAGTTSFCPASMTLSEEKLKDAYRAAVLLRDIMPSNCAVIRGITMEGPFFSEKKKGAQSAENLHLPDIDMFFRLQKAAGEMIRIACVAPELEGADKYIREVSRTGVTVAAAHTNADYEEACSGYDAGITHLTHLFNAMPPLLHREPGVIGAAAERENVTAELICDGVHVHPSSVRAAFKLFGSHRICFVSDASSACGAENGQNFLGGQRVIVKDGRATLEDGTIAGSVATLFECVKKAVSFGIPLEDTLRCAASNPARVLGAEEIGSIEEGKRADFLICGNDLSLRDVYLAGEKLERK